MKMNNSFLKDRNLGKWKISRIVNFGKSRISDNREFRPIEQFEKSRISRNREFREIENFENREFSKIDNFGKSRSSENREFRKIVKFENREIRRKSFIFGTGKKSVKTFVIFHGENFDDSIIIQENVIRVYSRMKSSRIHLLENGLDLQFLTK